MSVQMTANIDRSVLKYNEMIYNRVYLFLQSLNLAHYWDSFTAKGYDREDDLINLDRNDLDILYIDEKDRSTLLQAVADYQISDDFAFLLWLEQHGLGHYHENMLINDITSTSALANVDLTEDFFQEMEMVVPGHRKRLQRAVCKLHKKQKRVSETKEEPGEPVAVGYWGKPTYLTDSKNEFLCLRAVLESTKPHHNREELEFMVDSGSDVITLREEILNKLDLVPLGVVRSVGIHASKEKQLYLAKLWVGDVNLELEVMPEKFDSIGNQTLKSFRHYIDPKQHLWLRIPPQTDVYASQSDHQTLVSVTDTKSTAHNTPMDTQIQLVTRPVERTTTDERDNAADASLGQSLHQAENNASPSAQHQATSRNSNTTDVVEETVQNSDLAKVYTT